MCEARSTFNSFNYDGCGLEEKDEYDRSGRKTYIKTCETLGIIPTSYFLRTLQNGESQVMMSHHGIGPKGAKAIAISLAVSKEAGKL